MRRYGFVAEAAAVARDISRAASHFLLNQLPELYGGLQRDPASFPVQYLGANVPQAWALLLCSAVKGVIFLQSPSHDAHSTRAKPD